VQKIRQREFRQYIERWLASNSVQLLLNFLFCQIASFLTPGSQSIFSVENLVFEVPYPIAAFVITPEKQGYRSLDRQLDLLCESVFISL
jgi:peptidoglycan biosynthesis protein MviN/MurJ (putative lipid II flippase)